MFAAALLNEEQVSQQQCRDECLHSRAEPVSFIFLQAISSVCSTLLLVTTTTMMITIIITTSGQRILTRGRIAGGTFHWDSMRGNPDLRGTGNGDDR